MPNLKIGIKEHDLLRKIILEKYRQKDPNWSSGGNLNNYDMVAKHIRLTAKKRNDSLSVSAYQMQKLFTYHGESTYREDFVEACYLYCDAIRDANALQDAEPEVAVAPQTLLQEVDYFKATMQKMQAKSEELQQEIDHHIEQNIQYETTLDLQKTEIVAQKETIAMFMSKMEARNKQSSALNTQFQKLQHQLRLSESKLVEQNKALQHYTQLLQEHQNAAQLAEDALKQMIQDLEAEKEALIQVQKTQNKQKKRTFNRASIVFVVILILIMLLILILK
ncbi:MAG: hypothetical protein RL329_3132 [Bacteroidota bacterium]|jgi:DNA repair exonuclease SbcCD ATPase subunit